MTQTTRNTSGAKKIAVAVMVIVTLAWPILVWAQNSNYYVPLAAVTVTTAATLVCPAMPNRVGCNCHNNDTTIHVRFGDSTVTSTTGARFSAGADGAFTSSNSIHMAAESSSVTITCTDERK